MGSRRGGAACPPVAVRSRQCIPAVGASCWSSAACSSSTANGCPGSRPPLSRRRNRCRDWGRAAKAWKSCCCNFRDEVHRFPRGRAIRRLGAGAALSVQAAADDRAVPAGRRDGRHVARGGGAPFGRDGPAGGRGEPRRRERHHRRGSGCEGAGRRLHHHHGQHLHARGQLGPLCQASLRSGDELRADQHGRHPAARGRSASVAASAVAARSRALREIETRRAVLRHRGQLDSLGSRVLLHRRRHPDEPRAVQGQRAGDHRLDRRPAPGAVRSVTLPVPASARRKSAWPGGHDRAALVGGTRARHGRRAGIQGIRRQLVAGAGGSGRDAERDRREAASRHGEAARLRGDQGAVRQARRRARADLAGEIRRVHPRGDRALTEGGARCRSTTRVMKSLLVIWAVAFAGLASAQYPAKPIRMILAFPPGGPTDINARAFAQKLSDQMGQQVVVDNRAGAGGNIGAAEAARAAPDGYTIFYSTSAIAIAPALYSKIAFDPLKDFAPVVLAATVPLVLAVNPGLPVKTVQEFVAYAKANPSKMNYASSGAGTITHLAIGLFLTQIGLEMHHIPYTGSAPALVDVVSGQVQMMIDTISTVAPYAKENRLRALAIAITRRSALLPDVPTLEQAANLPGFEMSAWQGVVVPSGTSPEIVARLNAEVNKALQGADLRARLAAGGSEPLGGTSEQYAAYIRSELGRWPKVVPDSGAKLD